MPLPTVGSIAPDFTLPSTRGDDVMLSAFRGSHNVLIAFFPLAFTGTCTAEMCEFSTDYAAFQRHDTVVLPISVDSLPTLTAFKGQEQLAIDLLSDFHRTVSRQYGVLLEERNHSTRAYILVDTAGAVRWAYAEPNPGEKRSTADLLQHLGSLG